MVGDQRWSSGREPSSHHPANPTVHRSIQRSVHTRTSIIRTKHTSRMDGNGSQNMIVEDLVLEEHRDDLEYPILKALLAYLKRSKIKGHAKLHSQDETHPDMRFPQLDITTEKSEIVNVWIYVNVHDAQIDMGSIYHENDIEEVPLEDPNCIDIMKRLMKQKLPKYDEFLSISSKEMKMPENHTITLYMMGELVVLDNDNHRKR